MASERAEGAVDFAYLEAFASGDMRVVTEVLAMFRDQAIEWGQALAGPSPPVDDILHSIKGTAKSVGANALGDAAERAERAPGPAELDAVCAGLAAAVADIEGYLTRMGGG